MLSFLSCAQNGKVYADETSNITLKKKGFCKPELANNLKMAIRPCGTPKSWH